MNVITYTSLYTYTSTSTYIDTQTLRLAGGWLTSPIVSWAIIIAWIISARFLSTQNKDLVPTIHNAETFGDVQHSFSSNQPILFCNSIVCLSPFPFQFHWVVCFLSQVDESDTRQWLHPCSFLTCLIHITTLPSRPLPSPLQHLKVTS